MDEQDLKKRWEKQYSHVGNAEAHMSRNRGLTAKVTMLSHTYKVTMLSHTYN